MGKSQSKQPISEVKDGNDVRFALVGTGGCGKSAFVNAARGIDDEDELAASVDVVGTEQQPTEYIYPSNPHVCFCDLPGYGTPSYPDLETYWRILELEKFDIFLIFISLRVTELDLAIIKKVKSIKKSFFLIRTKIDVECMMNKDLLSKIKDYIVTRTKHLSCAEEDIFLISNYYPFEWDFFRLIQAIIHVMPSPEKDITQQYLAEARTYIKQNGVSGIEEFLRKKLEGSKDVKIRFGITGDSGTGKSTFINAIRGLNDDDDGAAKVDVVEATKEPTEYQHPNNQMIIFVDLPGIGTPNYPNLPIYSEKVGLEDYDTFLIFTANRFTQNDLELAKKVKSIGKSFSLIRTKIDVECTPREGRSINEQEILEKMNKDCIDNVKDLISSEKEIFLISNYHKDK
ncbi:interferon-inducible GTPase 5-like [Paramuricea clavata]|uniref:Interferon-inducible GTPase 5-like n=1 Tax=Paramuricea clavata TaxID=317549 RepID=A0A7D9I810_PARCT|nr:interferon-inducible GTPase 5-like [Paramuricea clavata]